MSGISSVGSSSTTSAYFSSLDTNQDGVVDSTELEAAAKSGLLSSSILADAEDNDSSATDKFSDSLASMLLQQMQQSDTTDSTTATGSNSSSTSDSSDQSSFDALFKSLDANGDGEVSSDEFVAARPQDMSETDAQSLFKTIDSENTGMLNESQFSQGIASLNDWAATATSTDQASASTSTDPLEAYIAEMQASLTAYQNTYGQYDLSAADTSSVAA